MNFRLSKWSKYLFYMNNRLTLKHIPFQPVHMKNLSLFFKVTLLVCIINFVSKEAFSQLELSSPNTIGDHTAPVSIILKPGFSTAPGQSFHAFITPGCILLGTTPSSSQNYIVTYTPRVAGVINPADPNNSTCDVMANVQYFDGLGRPIQMVQVKASPTLRDIVQPAAYDQFGREAIKFNPYSISPNTSSDGSFKANAIADQAAFYTNPSSWNAPNVTKNLFPFAATNFEPSPLNRVVEQGAPGEAWQLTGNLSANNSGHTTKLEYATNDASSLTSGSGRWAKQYAVQYDASGKPSLIDEGSYAINELYVNISKDENWVPSDGKAGTGEEYVDKEKRVVLKRMFNTGGEILSTYYVYDDFGSLVYVLPPKSEADISIPSLDILNTLCYQYRYDERRRAVEKKLPGKGSEFIVYNKLDQVVATQDSMQRINHQWAFIKYDGIGRIVVTGLWNNAGIAIDQAALKTLVYGQPSNWETRDNSNPTYKYYTNNSFPISNINTYLSINFYDDYNIPNLPTNYDQHLNFSQMTRGLLTASMTNVLGTSDLLWMVQYYDDEGRIIKVFEQHYLGGSASLNTGNFDEIINTYNFTNSITSTTRIHHAIMKPDLTIANNYDYDHVGRKIKTWENINNSGNILLSKSDYNEVGQLKIKHLHSSDNGEHFLQSISYQYNERGWLKKDSSSLFVMQLKYNEGNTPKYNGNISEQHWGVGNSLTKNYLYQYDKMNRLLSGISNEGFSEENISYDKMGNPGFVSRSTPSLPTTNYTFNYSGNQLTFVNGLSSSSYQYDGNGNVSFDAHNNANVTYNILNLPMNITGSKTISYIYDAGGNKLSRISANSTFGKEEYIRGIHYNNGAIEFFPTEEGSARRNTDGTYSYEYVLSDHLGNTRVRFDDSSHVARVIQKDDYYPFGLSYNRYSLGSRNNYLYNKKEWQEELSQYDYGARFYDPVVLRWNSIDPKAEKFAAFTPYNYAFDNPILVIDLDGQEGIVVIGQPGDHKYKKHFLENGLAKAKKLQKKFDKAGKGEKATILVYKGKDGDASYDSKQLAAFEKQAEKAGISVKVETDKDDIVDYVNNKNGGDSREKDKISNFTYVGHAAPGNLEVGYIEHGWVNDVKEMLNFQRLDIGAFNKNAFTSNSNADLVAACRTSLSSWIKPSAMEQMAEKVGGTVSGSNVRVDFWKAGPMTNAELLQSNKGQVITIQGHGGVSKQQSEKQNEKQP